MSPIRMHLCVSLSVLCLQAVAADWPQWRGPARDGVVSGLSLPEQWPDKLKKTWSVPVGLGHASPLVAGDRVYLHARQNEDEVVLCINLKDGQILWRQAYAAPYTMNPAARSHGPGPKSTPLVHQGRIYTLGISGILSCYSAATGRFVWQRRFDQDFPATSPLYGTATSPVGAGELVIAHVGGHDKGALIAFDAATGQTRWRWDGDGPGYTSPILVQFNGVAQIVTQTQRFCVGLDLASGRLLWQIPFTTDYDQNSVTPVLFEDRLIFSGLDRGVFAVKLEQQGSKWSAKTVWQVRDPALYMSTPVLHENRLWGFSHFKHGQYFSLDARQGTVHWTGPGRQGENAAVLRAGDVFFLLNDQGQLQIVRATDQGFALLAQYQVSDTPTWAHPALLDGGLLVKNLDSLVRWSMQ